LYRHCGESTRFLDADLQAYARFAEQVGAAVGGGARGIREGQANAYDPSRSTRRPSARQPQVCVACACKCRLSRRKAQFGPLARRMRRKWITRQRPVPRVRPNSSLSISRAHPPAPLSKIPGLRNDVYVYLCVPFVDLLLARSSPDVLGLPSTMARHMNMAHLRAATR